MSYEVKLFKNIYFSKQKIQNTPQNTLEKKQSLNSLKTAIKRPGVNPETLDLNNFCKHIHLKCGMVPRSNLRLI